MPPEFPKKLMKRIFLVLATNLVVLALFFSALFRRGLGGLPPASAAMQRSWPAPDCCAARRALRFEQVLGHEISHIASGDMVTLALLQGVLNTFVILLARIIGNVAALQSAT